MLLGLALYASSMILLVPLFTSCDRLFEGVYPSIAEIISSSATWKNFPHGYGGQHIG
jgi:hypothetical protein